MTSRHLWSDLFRPVRALVWLLIVLAALSIYHGADYLVVHVFSVALIFIFAAIVALAITPLVDALQRVPPFRSHRAIAALTLYMLGLAVLAGAVALIVPSVVHQFHELPALTSQVQVRLAQHGVHVDLANLEHSLSPVGLSAAIGVIAGVAATITTLVLIVVISIYLVIEGRVLVATLRNLFPTRTREFDFTMLTVGGTIGAYVRGQLIMCGLMGAYTGLTLTLIGVHYGILLGVAAFFLEFIPLAGAVVSMVLAVVVALLQSPLLAVLATVIGLLGHALDAYVVGPRVQGRVNRLHPLVAMAALLIGAALGGILGALFAVPLAAMSNIALGAAYRSRRGDEALSTHPGAEVTLDGLPRLGDEIGGVEEAGVLGEPVPHAASPRT